MVKKAFSLIELIFAIVVLSIAFLALPQLFESSTMQVEEVAKDEATFYGIKTLQDVYRYYWDDNSQNSGAFYILDTTNCDNELVRDLARDPLHRKGTVAYGSKAGQRKFFSTTLPATTFLGAEAGETLFDDIDDFNGFTATHTSSIVNTTTTVNVYYISDNANYAQTTLNFTILPTPATATTNIKMIEVNISDSSGNGLLLYRTIACNIGARKIETRDLR